MIDNTTKKAEAIETLGKTISEAKKMGADAEIAKRQFNNCHESLVKNGILYSTMIRSELLPAISALGTNALQKLMQCAIGIADVQTKQVSSYIEVISENFDELVLSDKMPVKLSKIRDNISSLDLKEQDVPYNDTLEYAIRQYTERLNAGKKEQTMYCPSCGCFASVKLDYEKAEQTIWECENCLQTFTIPTVEWIESGYGKLSDEEYIEEHIPDNGIQKHVYSVDELSKIEDKIKIELYNSINRKFNRKTDSEADILRRVWYENGFIDGTRLFL